VQLPLRIRTKRLGVKPKGAISEPFSFPPINLVCSVAKVDRSRLALQWSNHVTFRLVDDLCSILTSASGVCVAERLVETPDLVAMPCLVDDGKAQPRSRKRLASCADRRFFGIPVSRE